MNEGNNKNKELAITLKLIDFLTCDQTEEEKAEFLKILHKSGIEIILN